MEDSLAKSLQEDIDEGKKYYEQVIEPVVEERYNLYWADTDYYDKKFPKLSKSSKMVSTDVADTIEWALPSFMEVFFGSEDIVSISGEGTGDDEKASKMQKLIKWQLNKKNDSYMVFYNLFKDALITGMGVMKITWDREIRDIKYQDVMAFEQVNALRSAGANITKQTQVYADLFAVEYELPTLLKNQPKLENVPLSELLWEPKARSLKYANFVAHRKSVTIDYLRKQETQDVYKNIDQVVEKGREKQQTNLDQLIDDDYEYRKYSNDDLRREVEIFECYRSFDHNKDGMLEPIIATMCEGIIIRVDENIYGRHPFFDVSPMHDPHRAMPKRAYADMIGQLQDLKTAMNRQIVAHTALSNDPRMILSEEAINIDDYIAGRAIIRKKPGFTMSDVAFPMPVHPLATWTFNYLEYIEAQKENRTGITRYNQGLDASSLNKTATGISAIMSASSQRLRLIARTFAETGIKDAIRFMIALNQKFIDTTTTIRILDEPLEITPDDMNGDFDLTVNAGAGMGTKEMTMMNIQQLMSTLMQMAGAGMPFVTQQNLYNVVKKYIEELGYKSADMFITDPSTAMQQGGMLSGLPTTPDGRGTAGLGQSGGSQNLPDLSGTSLSGTPGIDNIQNQLSRPPDAVPNSSVA